MNIDIIKLKNGIVDKIDLDEEIIMNEELSKTDIIDLKNTKLTGYITKINDEDYYINARLYGIMVLPCSLTLKPTNVEFDTNIEGNINEMLEEMGKISKKGENTLDILPIIWENILMEIPMKVVNEEVQDVKLEGEGWKVITKIDEDNEVTTNPELEKLKDLLK